ncbi:MAG: amidohydrolase [Bacteroidetes bacterium]|nr:amidohydrolase [Bacteroidota bacterium]
MTMHRMFFLAGLLMTACSTQQHCDLLITNATVHTMDDNGSVVEAFAVRDGRIVAVGSTGELRSTWSAERLLDMDGAVVFPGFIDAHAHLYGLGEEAVIVALHGTLSVEEVMNRVRIRIADLPAGQWIRGRGWDQNDWAVPQFPNNTMLDDVTRDHPIFLSRIDGHAAWVNSRALEIAGITADTPDPVGGRILRDAEGNPTGILLDNAIELVRSNIPPPSQQERRLAYLNAVHRCLATGMTAMHDMGMDAEDITAVSSLIEEDRFPFRMVGYVDGRGDCWEDHLKKGRQTLGNQQLVVAGLKLYADGALGSRGAWLFSPYSDDPGNSGIPIIEKDTIVFEARRAIAHGMQVCVHAIGDAAARLVLDSYEEALRDASVVRYPLRVEHAQVLHPDDIPRFAHLGVVASVQPTHCTSDMEWAEARLGADRILGAYAWNALIASGATLAGGSDFPVERPDPLLGIYAAAFRMDDKGRPSSPEHIGERFIVDPAAMDRRERWENGWYASQRMSREQAVRAFTSWAAFAAGMDNDIGSLVPGRWADFVLLSQNILTIPRERFLDTRILETWVGGERVYHAGE